MEILGSCLGGDSWQEEGVKLDALWHRVALLYVDEFRVIVILVLGLVVDRWERVCQPLPPSGPS